MSVQTHFRIFPLNLYGNVSKLVSVKNRFAAWVSFPSSNRSPFMLWSRAGAWVCHRDSDRVRWPNLVALRGSRSVLQVYPRHHPLQPGGYILDRNHIARVGFKIERRIWVENVTIEDHRQSLVHRHASHLMQKTGCRFQFARRKRRFAEIRLLRERQLKDTTILPHNPGQDNYPCEGCE